MWPGSTAFYDDEPMGIVESLFLALFQSIQIIYAKYSAFKPHRGDKVLKLCSQRKSVTTNNQKLGYDSSDPVFDVLVF